MEEVEEDISVDVAAVKHDEDSMLVTRETMMGVRDERIVRHVR